MQNPEQDAVCLIFGEFTGEPGVHERLNRAVRILVQEHGVRHFLIGPGDDFDWVAAQAVVRLRPLYKDLVLTRLHPAACWESPLPPYFNDELFPSMRPQRGRPHNLAKAVRTVLPQVGHVVLYEPFPCSWIYDAVVDIRRRAAAGKLTLWDVSFPA